MKRLGWLVVVVVVTGLAMAPRRSRGAVGTLVLLTLVFALAAFAGREKIANLASKDAAAMLGHPVSGVVIDGPSGRPIAGARVTSDNEGRTPILAEGWTAETRTNARGQFTVRAASDDEADASDIDVTASGYRVSHARARFDEHMTIVLWPISRAGD